MGYIHTIISTADKNCVAAIVSVSKASAALQRVNLGDPRCQPVKTEVYDGRFTEVCNGDETVLAIDIAASGAAAIAADAKNMNLEQSCKLDNIETEMKIMNQHNMLITNSEITQEDVEK